MARMARLRVSEVTSSSFWISGRTVPMARVTAAVAAPAVDLAARVDRDDVPLAQRSAVGDAVHDLLVDAGADHRGERRLSLDRAGIAQKQRGGVVFAEDRGHGLVHVGGGHAGHGHPANLVERLGDDPPRLAHQRDFARALQLDDGRRLGLLPAAPSSGPAHRPEKSAGIWGRDPKPRWEDTSRAPLG